MVAEIGVCQARPDAGGVSYEEWKARGRGAWELGVDRVGVWEGVGLVAAALSSSFGFLRTLFPPRWLSPRMHSRASLWHLRQGCLWISYCRQSQQRHGRVHRLTGRPLLISRSHLLFRPRQLRHARYARIGSTAGGRPDTPGTLAIEESPVIAFSLLGLVALSFASRPLSTTVCGGGAAIAERAGNKRPAIDGDRAR